MRLYLVSFAVVLCTIKLYVIRFLGSHTHSIWIFMYSTKAMLLNVLSVIEVYCVSVCVQLWCCG